MKSILDPVVLFFILGSIAGIVKSDLRVPQSFYNTISIYLLLSIGIKGGIELYHSEVSNILFPIFITLLLGACTTLIAHFILRKTKKFNTYDAISIATHYGSVSAVTFAVVLSYLKTREITYEKYMTVLLVMLEIPALITGVFLAQSISNKPGKKLPEVLKEVFLGKSILLIVGGLLIGYAIGYTNNKQINFFFFDLFKGFLCLFMLEMGIITSERFKDLKKVGITLILFGTAMPIISACLGIATAIMADLSEGGAIVFATMAASASYIAAPAAMKIALPQANVTYSLTAALGITFPFNIIVGIPLYSVLAHYIYL
ncbi:MAG: sodium-dependent bicarbonate transport family permease [Flavobacteriales bacterium]